MSDPPPPKRPLADVLEDIVFDEALREQRAMTPEQLQADLQNMGYDPDAFGQQIDAVLHAAVSPRRPLADVLEDIVFDEALREQRAMTPEQIRAEVAPFDGDRGALEAAIAGAMTRAGLPAFDPAPDPSKLQNGATSKVVDLQAARDRRAAKTRWHLFLPMAAGFALAGGGLTQKLATTMPVPDVLYPTNTAPPSLHAIAESVRSRALRQCAMYYWSECQDTLDQAKAIDPDGETEPAVLQARRDIDRWTHGFPPGVEPDFHPQSKPSLGPGERRLQRLPRK